MATHPYTTQDCSVQKVCVNHNILTKFQSVYKTKNSNTTTAQHGLAGSQEEGQRLALSAPGQSPSPTTTLKTIERDTHNRSSKSLWQGG